MIQQIVTTDQGRGFYPITQLLNDTIRDNRVKDGLCHVFIQHTSASLLITENADPQVLNDLENYMQRLVIDGDRHFTHTLEGPDDMAAHIRSTLTQTQLTIPIADTKLALGTWQGVFVWEHRYQPHKRRLLIQLMT